MLVVNKIGSIQFGKRCGRAMEEGRERRKEGGREEGREEGGREGGRKGGSEGGKVEMREGGSWRKEGGIGGESYEGSSWLVLVLTGPEGAAKFGSSVSLSRPFLGCVVD